MGTVLMVALAGFFLGGVYSFWRGGNKPVAIVLGLFALLSLAAAVLWVGG